MDPTKAELLEIIGQLGLVGYSEDDDHEALLQALYDEGLDDQTIADEVAEQRGR
jgi:hypothetical protein